MAQTIAAQRGTTTVSGNGTTPTTLWTQSTGVATRVILNSVVMKHDTSFFSRFSLLLNVNGSGNYAAVAAKGVSNQTASSNGLIMMPGSMTPSMGSIPTGQANTSLPDRYIVATISGNTYLFTNMSNTRWRFYGPGSIVNTYENGCIDFVPQQFWMNSGDSLVAICHNSDSFTCDLLYSFTTITET